MLIVLCTILYYVGISLLYLYPQHVKSRIAPHVIEITKLAIIAALDMSYLTMSVVSYLMHDIGRKYAYCCVNDIEHEKDIV